MRPGRIGLILASFAGVLAANSAQAVICYVVYDRGQNVIYQSSYPPVDMSNAGYPAREAMRARGEHMTFGDITQCPTVVFLTGVGGMSDVRVDEVVAGLPVRSFSTNTQAAAAASAAEGIRPGPTPTGFRSPSAGKSGY